MSTRPKLKLQRRSVLGVVIGAIALLVLVGGGLLFTSTATVAADEFAIKQVYFGPGKGIQETVYGPGTHITLPGYERLHHLPRDLQVLNFNDQEKNDAFWQREDKIGAPSISIQTSDGYQVTVDSTVMFRIKDPYTIVTRVGAGRLYEQQIVVKRSDLILREVLGKLDAEDFYNDVVRVSSAEEARKKLQAVLEEWGIQVWAVLVRHYRYDSRFQSVIEAKKIEDQRRYKNQAEQVREKKNAQMIEMVAQWKARIQVVEQEGKTKVRQIQSDGNLYYRQKVAAGDKAVKLANADGARMEREALEAAGASNLVGLEMAKAMEGIDLIIVPTTGKSAMNPLDLDALLEGW